MYVLTCFYHCWVLNTTSNNTNMVFFILQLQESSTLAQCAERYSVPAETWRNTSGSTPERSRSRAACVTRGSRRKARLKSIRLRTCRDHETPLFLVRSVQGMLSFKHLVNGQHALREIHVFKCTYA